MTSECGVTDSVDCRERKASACPKSCFQISNLSKSEQWPGCCRLVLASSFKHKNYKNDSPYCEVCRGCRAGNAVSDIQGERRHDAQG